MRETQEEEENERERKNERRRERKKEEEKERKKERKNERRRERKKDSEKLRERTQEAVLKFLPRKRPCASNQPAISDHTLVCRVYSAIPVKMPCYPFRSHSLMYDQPLCQRNKCAACGEWDDSRPRQRRTREKKHINPQHNKQTQSFHQS
jgi:signal recognition particle GTPase